MRLSSSFPALLSQVHESEMTCTGNPGTRSIGSLRCPIRHALRMKSLHSRYRFYFEYGDAEHYRAQIEALRRPFEDIKVEGSGK